MGELKTPFMPRPRNKEELLARSHETYQDLVNHIQALSVEQQHALFPMGTLNRNVRDVLAHLHHWHLMFEDWYEVGMRGEKPDIPAKGFTWKTTPDLNRVIQLKYSNTPMHEVLSMLDASHQRVHSLIGKHTDEELFEKKRYKWTGSTSLGAYLIGATSSHYDWALKLIRKCLKVK